MLRKLILPVCLSIFTISSNAQVIGINRGTAEQVSSFPFVDLSSSERAHSSAQIQEGEEERASRHDFPKAPPIFNEVDPSKSGVHYLPQYHFDGDWDALHRKDSDVIAIGTVNPLSAHLTKGKGFVYTIFDFTPSDFIKDSSDSQPLHLEREGGFVRLPSGKMQFVGVVNYGLPLAGYKYVLFLKKTPQTNYLEIVGGFALLGSSVLSLDRDGSKYNSLSEETLIYTIRKNLASVVSH